MSKFVQESFLESLKAEYTPVAIYLKNGIKLLGRIEVYDDEVILLGGLSKQMVFKKTIATIMPTLKGWS